MYDMGWMRRAYDVAKTMWWKTHPNPCVGAVIVKDGAFIAEGTHLGSGHEHAEIIAIQKALAQGVDLRGADIYVTLEPCSHFGKMPPCAHAIVEQGFANCYIGTLDPNPQVRGKGIEALRAAGIHCVVGILEEELWALNAAFFKRVHTNIPYITCKWAMSLDGRIATRTGHSQWITGAEARRDVHYERALHDAIIVGTDTLRLDNPALTVRHVPTERQPLRIALDRQLRIPLDATIFDTKDAATVLVTDEAHNDLSAYVDRGATCVRVPVRDQKLDLEAMLRILTQEYSVTTLYCEGGAGLLGTMMDKGWVDRCDVYLGAMILGGAKAKSPVGGLGADTIAQSHAMRCVSMRPLGEDVCIRYLRKDSEVSHVYGVS